MPDRKQDRSGGRPEFEVAYYTKELGQSLQRQMLQKQLARFSSSSASTGSHAEEPATDEARTSGDRDAAP